MEKFDEIKALERVFETEFVGVETLEQFEKIRVQFLGKNGELNALMARLPSMPQEERKAFGGALNLLRKAMEGRITLKQADLESKALEQSLRKEWVDVTAPVSHNLFNTTPHPLRKAADEIISIFAAQGFELVDGPEIEDDWHNFEALNFDPLHPAKQMHDTFHCTNTQTNETYLLRTHTSSVQIRYMAKHKSNMRIISLGRVYRADYDATHTPMFHQVEGLCVEPGVSIAHLKGTIEVFLEQFFEKKVPIRIRQSYFPFTEPSMEVDILCNRTEYGKIVVGEGSDWLEVMGCGMVHKNVFKNVGMSDESVGFAFGMGVERMLMLKYGISDIRHIYDSNMRRWRLFEEMY